MFLSLQTIHSLTDIVSGRNTAFCVFFVIVGLVVFELHVYGNASGAKLIFKKSEIVCIGLGCLKDKMEDVYGISETNIRKILGIFLGKTKGDRM